MHCRTEVEEATVTDPAQPRPVPGPPRPVPGPATHRAADAETAAASSGISPFAGLADRPVADHVAIYEAEHERLQRELSTIDQL
jgi:hypothetical protein